MSVDICAASRSLWRHLQNDAGVRAHSGIPHAVRSYNPPYESRVHSQFSSVQLADLMTGSQVRSWMIRETSIMNRDSRKKRGEACASECSVMWTACLSIEHFFDRSVADISSRWTRSRGVFIDQAIDREVVGELRFIGVLPVIQNFR